MRELVISATLDHRLIGNRPVSERSDVLSEVEVPNHTIVTFAFGYARAAIYHRPVSERSNVLSEVEVSRTHFSLWPNPGCDTDLDITKH